MSTSMARMAAVLACLFAFGAPGHAQFARPVQVTTTRVGGWVNPSTPEMIDAGLARRSDASTAVDHVLYFGVLGRLWVTDGAPAGTRQVSATLEISRVEPVWRGLAPVDGWPRRCDGEPRCRR